MITGDTPSGLDCSIPLPITLLSFTGTSTSCDNIVLTWITSAELNNDYFEILRGKKSEDFVPIGKVIAVNSITGNNYNFIDDSDLNPGEEYYYKIKQVDLDGSFKIFKIISVRNNCKNTAPEMALYPNPASDIIHISFSGIEENLKTELVFINALGIVVRKIAVSTKDTNEIEISDLPAGIYDIHTLNQPENMNFKFVRIK